MESSDKPVQESIQTHVRTEVEEVRADNSGERRVKAYVSPGRMTLDGSAGLNKSKVSIPDVFRDIACN